MPSAFIPFCAYDMNMKALGKKSNMFSFPMCDSFKPMIHRGQVCYKLQPASELLQSKVGMDGGLMLLVDNNFEKSITPTYRSKSENNDLNYLNIQQIDSKSHMSAHVYIPTLAPFIASKPGTYPMFALKKMTGTESFLQMPDQVKQCHNELFEECQMKEALRRGQEECGCLPWAFTSVVNEVSKQKKFYFSKN